MSTAWVAKVVVIVTLFSIVSYSCLNIISAVVITIVGGPDFACIGLSWVRHIDMIHVGAAVACEGVAMWLFMRSMTRQ